MRALNPTQLLAAKEIGYLGKLALLCLCAVLLLLRLGYSYLEDANRFPITTIKVAASYEHITHKDLEAVLAPHLDASFFALSTDQLQKDLSAMQWIETATVERLWPDTLKIKLVEKKPVAIWQDALMTADGKLFNNDSKNPITELPLLKGPDNQQLDVLQMYEKLSKILASYGLQASGLSLSANQAWVLSLGNKVKIYLGKKELEDRLLRFCKAYPAIFAEKIEQLAGVDLRYPRGMAVQWKQPTGR